MIFNIPISPFITVIMFCTLLSGLTYLALRRRDELLEEFLVPEPNSENERAFLDRLGVVLDELPHEQEEEEAPKETVVENDWGDLPDWINQQQMAEAT